MRARPIAAASLLLLSSSSLSSMAEDRASGPAGAARGEDTRPLAMKAVYFDRGTASGKCTAGTARDAAGHEPSFAGRYPVFIYLTGTTMKFNGPEAQKITSEMARRGFVAVAVDYDNTSYPYCSAMEEKAKCIFAESLERSAVAKICAHPTADCGKGIVVSGFSQGANLAALSRNHNHSVVAAYLMGHGDRANNLLDVSRCADDQVTQLAPNQMRSINGERDGFFGLHLEGVRKQLQRVVGVSCAQGHDCIQSDGSGWHVIPDAELADRNADHCYFFHQADGRCATYAGLDPEWVNGQHPWSLGPNLDWLKSRVQALEPGFRATAAR